MEKNRQAALKEAGLGEANKENDKLPYIMNIS